MADGPLDFAVLGSNPLALLLAGLLASVHGKSVVLISEAHSTFRLTRGFDLSVAPITRPETWAVLQRTVPEVRKLLAGFGAKAAIERIDPLLVAETAAGAEALMHLRHLLLAQGVPIERLTADGAGATYRIRDALFLRRSQLAAPAQKWLAQKGVRTIAADGAAVTFLEEGARIERGDESIAVARVIAADDNATLAHTDAQQRGALLRAETVTTILTEPMAALAAPMTLIVDRGIVLLQRKGGTVQALAGGGADAVARVGAKLSGRGRLRRAGQTGFTAIVPVDGAPLVGSPKGQKVALVSGFGPVAAFLAPAIARYFAGAATPEEQAFFAAREASSEGSRSGVADFEGSYALGSAS